MTCSSTINTFDIGDIVRLQCLFETAAGTDTDPPVVLCKVEDPNGTETTYTYGTDTNVIRKDSTGNYSCYVAPTVGGKWIYKWFGTDALTALYQRVAGAEEGAFIVRYTVIG